MNKTFIEAGKGGSGSRATTSSAKILFKLSIKFIVSVKKKNPKSKKTTISMKLLRAVFLWSKRLFKRGNAQKGL